MQHLHAPAELYVQVV